MVLRRTLGRAFYGAYLASLLALALIAAELYLRAQVFDPTVPYVLLPGWEITFLPSPEGTPGIHRQARSRINSLGLRGEVPARSASPRVLAIGGSTTEEIMLEFPESWPGLLQKHLRECHPAAWVGNAGKAGTNARHHAIQIEMLLARLGRIGTVVVLAGLNDMLYDFRMHHPEHLPADWDLKQAFMYLPSAAASWYDQLAVYRLARRLAGSAPQPEQFRIVDFGTQTLGYKLRRRAVRPEDFIREVPDMTEPLARYRQELERIVVQARRHGAALVFATQPSIWTDDPGPEELSRLYAGGLNGPDQWMLDARNPWYHYTVLARMLDRYNDVMRAACREHGLRCVDLAATMPKSAAFFFDDFHFSAEGSAFAARQIAAGLAGSCHARPQNSS